MTTHILIISEHMAHMNKPMSAYGLGKVIVFYTLDEPTYNTPEKNEEIKNNVLKTLKNAEDTYKSMCIAYESIKINGEEFEKNLELFRDIIKQENDVIINLTGGRKLVSFALQYAAMYESEHVSKIIFVGDEDKIFELPKNVISIKITPMEEKILELLKQGEKTMTEIKDEFGISLPAVLKHVENLENKNLVKSEKIGRTRTIRLA